MKTKVALVMGGGAGTGRATALAFTEEGASVVIADVNEEGGRETLAQVQATGGHGLFVGADMSEAADVQNVVTLRGIWLCMKYQLPLIEASGGGAIVNVASVSGIRGEAFQSAYAAAKGGVINLSKTVAVEYAKRGIRVNTVCPGGINSGGMAFYLEKMPEMRERALKAHAMGRLAEPKEIADAVVYLCSDRASFITGHDLVVDGGVMVRSNVVDI